MTENREQIAAWIKHDPPGAEFAAVTFGRDRLRARGVAIGSAPTAYRLDYALETGDAYVTRRLSIDVCGEGWRRRLCLSREEQGRWQQEAESVGALDLEAAGNLPEDSGSACDPDLGLSPLFNTMPLLRMRGPGVDDPADFVMLWISVPDLALRLSRQRYTTLRTGHRGRIGGAIRDARVG